MTAAGLLLVFLCFLAGGTTVALGTYAASRRGEPGASSFAWLMGGSALWSFSYGIALLVFEDATRMLFEIPIEVAQAIVAPAWLFFALGYTGRSELVTRRVVGVSLIVPGVTLVLLATNPSHHLMWSNYHVEPVWNVATVAFREAPWFFVHAFYGYLLVGSGMLLIFGMFVSHPRLYREQAVALGVGSLVPTVAHVAATFDLGPVPQVNFTPVALAVMGMTFAYGLFRFDLFGLAPATYRLGRRGAIDDVGVALVIVDDRGRVIELNETAEVTFDISESGVRGDPLDALTGEGFDAADGAMLELRSGGERRVFETTVSDISDQHGRRLGRTIAFTDVTERERRRQLLEVHNRLLRHNLRNGMSVVLGNADVLAEETDGELAGVAAAIRDRSQRLLAVARKAAEVDRIVEGNTGPEPVDVAALVREVAEEVSEEYPEVDIAVRGGAGTANTRRDVLEVVLRNLVENAAEHGARTPDPPRQQAIGEGSRSPPGGPETNAHEAPGNNSPTVSVKLRRESDSGGGPDSVVVAVIDDGPGIPKAELAAVRAGEETPLEHGSGMGLWLVRWGVERLGGKVEFETPESGGTVVELRLPADDGDGA